MKRCSVSQDDATTRANDSSASADAALEKMGYKSELPRNLGMMSVLGLYELIFTQKLPNKAKGFIFTDAMACDGIGLLRSWLRPSG